MDLQSDISCDVLIIGGGSSGAQCAYYLAKSELDVVIIEKNTIGSGSTSNNTALIQYSGEKMFTDMIHTFGEDYINTHLRLLKEAINEMEMAAKEVSIDCEFHRRDTLYAASKPEDLAKLKQEYDYLKQQQCEVDFLSKEEIEAKYPFTRSGAIYSYNDAEINPFKFTHALIEDAANKGVYRFMKTQK